MSMHICYKCCIAQLVTCLTADPGVASLIPALSHIFAELYNEKNLLPFTHSTDSRKVVVSYK